MLLSEIGVAIIYMLFVFVFQYFFAYIYIFIYTSQRAGRSMSESNSP